ncbi:TRAP transporter small permease [Cognatishimia activa]|uniref:TRAP transporter small permease protein n=1 Tax=Cognatishimia activa TaxID=1715691 RepID=A0A0P1IP05_9RHOB|nr:TRAP transporter small permease subunit [Cognatishimia activa]CUI94455.1 TRAP-type C4-dicarboxylate transport system, small permease component [Cognatishimia activa]CUK25234.1 TRAP-type C4-dicarboxylate transport system, small permease component [Cognatishimia activa]
MPRIIVSLFHMFSAMSRICIFIAFAVLALAVLTQVLGRSVGSSPVWTEELTRFALIYLAALGAGFGLMTGDLVNVDIVCDFLPGEFPRYFRIASSILTAILAIALLPGAWKFFQIGGLQISPALGLQMTFTHFAILAMMGLLLAFAVLRTMMDILKLDYRSVAGGSE